MFLTNLIGALGVAVSCGFTGLQPKRAGGSLTKEDGNKYTFTYRYSDMDDFNSFIQHTMTTDYSVYTYYTYVNYTTQSIVYDYTYVNVSSANMPSYNVGAYFIDFLEHNFNNSDIQVGFIEHFYRWRVTPTRLFYSTLLFSGRYYNGMYYFEGDSPLPYSRESLFHPGAVNVYWTDSGLDVNFGEYPWDDDDFELTWANVNQLYYSVSNADLIAMGAYNNGFSIYPCAVLGNLLLTCEASITDFDTYDMTLYNQRSFTIYGVEGFNPQDYYDEGYRNGRNDGYQSGYDKGYDDGAEVGAQVGYNNGYTAGVASSNDYTFLGLFGAVADTPVLVVRSLFNFDLFGVNLLTVVLSLFTALILFYLLRKLL